MASLRSKHTTNSNVNNNLKISAKYLDPISGSHQSNGNISHQSTRPLLRWSQSFSPNDRQKPSVSTLIRRKSAVERLAETKYNYIKSSTVDRDVNDKHTYLTKSLSTGKTPLSILSQNPIQSPVILPLNTNNQNPNPILKCEQNIQTLALSTPQAVTRKRNSSLSSRLSDCSNNLEIQLRQLIADNDDNESEISETKTTNNRNHRKDSVIKSVNKTIESSVKPKPKPKPKERINTTNQQIVKQTVETNQRNIINKTIDKTFVENNNNNCILRLNSSHKHKTTTEPNPQPKPLQRKPSAQVILQHQKVTQPAGALGVTTSRQLSISRSKSDVSNRLVVRRNKSKDEIERFFETLGLDSTVWDSIRSEATNSLISTPNHYFDSCESMQSGAVRHAVRMSSSSSSTSSTHSTTAEPLERQKPVLNTRLMQSRSCHTLSEGTSIVEKNARVIKWLYNCRKAMVQH